MESAPAQDERTRSIKGSGHSGDWYTLESENFLVHFPGGSERLATRVADIAEEVHASLSKCIEWETDGRTHVIILDWFDYMNGWSSPVPRNTITIYPVGPGISELELTFTDDWLRLLITHEYVHTLTLDMANGMEWFFEKVFGRSVATVPNVFMPNWILEGYAVYHETKNTRGGRIRGPYFDMVLRMAVLEEKFNTVSQAQVGVDTWPLSTQYIYGAMFMHHLAQAYGEEHLFEIYRRQSYVPGPIAPWLPGQLDAVGLALYWLAWDPVGRNGRGIFSDVSYKVLWNNWHEALRTGYEKKRIELDRKGLTFSRRRTETGYRTAEPRFSPDGRHIAYVSRGSDRYAQLRLMNIFGKEDRILHQGSVQSLCWSPDGKKIVFSKLDYWRGLYQYCDLYVYELETGRVRRLTHGLRARCPSWSPDGGKILFAINTGGGNTDIAVLDLESRENPVTYLTKTDDLSFYSGCAWSPDGGRIAFVRLEPGKLQQIYTANPDGSDIRPVTDGQAQDMTPSWSPDGQYLLFSSSRTGIFNIFACSLETGKTVQLTNLLGGGISPSLSPDGTLLAFTCYSSEGWDIHTAQVRIDEAPEARPHEAVLSDLEYAPVKGEYEIRDYSVLNTILPTAWTPFFQYTGDCGALVAGSDVLEKHAYTLLAGYNPLGERPLFGFLYSYEGMKYRGLPLKANLRAAVQPVLFYELMEDLGGDYVDYWENQTVLDAGFGAVVWRTTEAKVELSLGYEFTRMERISHLEPGGTVPGTGDIGACYLGVLFDDTNRYRLGVSAADGRTVSLMAKSAGPSIGSDFRIDSLTARWSEYVTVPWTSHHVLMGRLAGGISEGDIIDKRSYFRVGAPEQVLPMPDNEHFPLRGYGTSKFRGTRAAVLTLEYHLPIWLIEGGPATRPVFFEKLSGYFFVDTGNAWTGSARMRDFKTGAGFGIRLSLSPFYLRMDSLALDLGFAHGFDSGGIDQFYLTTSLMW
jgi:hypothetical protein